MFKDIKKLNGWQRIGLVLSVAWMLYGGYRGNEYGLDLGNWVWEVHRACVDDAWAKRKSVPYSESANQQVSRDVDACDAESDRNWPEASKYHWHYAAIYALVPIPLAWLLIYGLIALVRWIRAGFIKTAENR
jgi:hypothetical protein